MKKVSLILSFLLLNFIQSNAQVEDTSVFKKEHYLILGGGISHISIIDRGISPHLYTGFGPSGLAGYSFKGVKFKHDLFARFDYAQTENTYEFSSANINASRGDVYYSIGYNLKNTCWFIGASWANVWYLRERVGYTNNRLHNDLYSSLGPSASYQKKFVLFNRDFQANAHAFLPIASYVIRPMFASTTHRGSLLVEEPGFLEYMRSGDFVGLGVNRGVQFIYDLQYQMLNGNRLRLSYEWHMRRNAGLNNIVMAEHNLSFAILFNLSRP